MCKSLCDLMNLHYEDEDTLMTPHPYGDGKLAIALHSYITMLGVYT